MQYAPTGGAMRYHWKDFTIAPDQTHHLKGGSAAYEARFEEVLKFHAPGLAPVRDASGAYHIFATGRASYTERYFRTFGFYERREAVQARCCRFPFLACRVPLH